MSVGVFSSILCFFLSQKNGGRRDVLTNQAKETRQLFSRYRPRLRRLPNPRVWTESVDCERYQCRDCVTFVLAP